jgi:predicted phage terminase large subunit-like protein
VSEPASSLVNVGSVDYLDALEQDLERRSEGLSLREEGDRLAVSMWEFVRAAWREVLPDIPFVNNWHIGAMCEQLEEITAGRNDRLLIWVPPGSMKTITTSVMWPCWEWTTKPWLRYMTCTYDMEMQIEQGALPSRMLLESDWYRERWGHMVALREDQNKRAAFGNDRGGARYCAAPNAKKVTGRHVHRIIIDDPNDPESSDNELRAVSDWHDAKLTTRLLPGGAKVVIQQRLHERDLSGYLVERDEWRVLCLPERYNPKHPFAWPADPRKPQELLWPARYDEEEHRRRREGLGSHNAAGQLDQEPTSPEGDILKRKWWRFYDPRIRTESRWAELGRLQRIVVSVDCPLKDTEQNDLISIQVWGVRGGDRLLLDIRTDHMSLPQANRAVTEMTTWARATWKRVRADVLIENGGYGKELIKDLQRSLGGIHKIAPAQDGDKIVRAKSASGDLETGNVWVPGYGPPAHPSFDELMSPADVVAFVVSCTKFPKGPHDDDVDAWSQAMNWLHGRSGAPLRTASALVGRRKARRLRVTA